MVGVGTLLGVLFMGVWGFQSHGATQVTIRYTVTVYKNADFSSPVLTTLEPGARIAVSDRETKGFKRIRYRLNGKNQLGYVATASLNGQNEAKPLGFWGGGGGLRYTQLTQGGKSFSTKDQVTYKIESLAGKGSNPELTMQFKWRHFYRLYGVYRTVSLTGDATTNVTGNQKLPIQIDYKLLGVGVSAAWSFWHDVFYLGSRLEGAKALSGATKFAGQTLPDDGNLPSYVTLSALLGAQVRIWGGITGYGEVGMGSVLNQSPMISALEVSAGLIYWP